MELTTTWPSSKPVFQLDFVRLISALLQSLFFLLLLQLERLLKKWQTLITRAKLIIQYATFPFTNVRVGAEKRSNARRPVSVLSPMGWANKKQFAFYKMAHRPITPHQNPSELEINITWLRWAFDQVSYRWTCNILYFNFHEIFNLPTSLTYIFQYILPIFEIVRYLVHKNQNVTFQKK